MTVQLFEKKVWRTGSGVWRWRVRVEGRYPVASGVAASRKDADDKIKAAIEAHEVEIRAPWKRVTS